MIPAETYIELLFTFLAALAGSLGMVPVLRRWGVEHNVLDQPGERKVHRHAVPRLGGVAICLSSVIPLLLCADFSRGMRGMLAGLLIIFATGAIDDLYGLSPLRKLLGQILAVLATMSIGDLYVLSLGDLFGAGEILLPFWLAVPFTLVAVVGVVNAFNLIDGLDGLAGGIAVTAVSAFGLLAFSAGNSELLLVCVALVGALLGFLRYNFFPARIFMGDAGSLSLGFLMAFIAVGLTQGEGSRVQPVVPLLVIGIPVADAVRVMVTRLCCGNSPFAADRTHVHHKLLDLGLAHGRAVMLICGASMICSGSAVSLRDQQAALIFAGYVGVTVLAYLVMSWIGSGRGFLISSVRTEATGRVSPRPYLHAGERVAAAVTVMSPAKSRADPDLAARSATSHSLQVRL